MKKETLQVIKKRHSVRIFRDEPLSCSNLMTILEAANQAPSAHNQQSWKFFIITGNKKEELTSIVSKAAENFPRPSSTLLRMAGRSIHSAPVIIAVVNTGELINSGTMLYKVQQEQARDFFRTMEIQSSAAAVENMLLAATSLGIGTVWLGILFLIKAQVLEFLQQPGGEFMAVIPLGYPVRISKGPRKKNLAEMIHYI
ncbi:MAG: nitroreductase family protein [Candidatus Cloacimonetes bacterium]|nr:nitroreductase family protein [Candidatus Cloacimonadota bacterium]